MLECMEEVDTLLVPHVTMCSPRCPHDTVRVCLGRDDHVRVWTGPVEDIHQWGPVGRRGREEGVGDVSS